VIQGSYGIWGSSRLLYQAASYLAIQIFQESNSTLREYENWALWAVFDPTDALAEMNQNGVNQAGCEAIFGTGAWVSNKCTAGTGNGGYLANAKSSGPAAYSAGMFNNLMIYVPQNLALTGPCTTPGKCDSQEFFGMVQAPDGGSTLLYLTIVSGVCFGAIFLKNRSKDVSISAV
ncbi:MAG TPA: hypothetical protein VMT53_16465, partial [Terriglobales bacterium]|nr:hypothetical protein [Terriglobales bacterium]